MSPHKEGNQDPMRGAGSMVVSLVEVIFSNVVFAMVVFVIAHCHKMHNISPHEATAVEALISLSAVVQEDSHNHKRC